MQFNCPGCNTAMEFDVSQIDLVLLKLKCGSCRKQLSLRQKNSPELTDDNRELKMDRIRDLVALAWSDGNLTDDEKRTIKEKAREIGVTEEDVQRMLTERPTTPASAASSSLRVEYDESMDNYRVPDTDVYDDSAFMEKISSLTKDDPNLKHYRNDLLKMLEHNVDAWKEKARHWEELHEKSTLESDWREAREGMERCFEVADTTSEFYNELSSISREKFLHTVSSIVSEGSDEWD